MTTPIHAGHPRLFFTRDELVVLRQKRTQGLHAKVWRNMSADADWCLTRPHRTQWIAPIADDPIYANLYDRFYGMMHDMGIAEHLAFAAAIGQDKRHIDGAREWARSLARVWIKEAEGDADASKAYAATRVLKGMAVAYDLLYEFLDDADRVLLRDSIAAILGKYVAFFVAKGDEMFRTGYEPHHASVEAASLGVAALAIVGEVAGSEAWLDYCTRWHTDFLLGSALTPSGTHNQTSNFYISIMQYRVSFMDGVRRVTGRDLFKEFAKPMQSMMAYAAPVGRGRKASEPCAQTNQSWLHGPSYGQIDYASCVLVALAREYRSSTLQRVAFWDEWLGGVQRSRYVSKRGDTMVFAWGGYAYAWLDETVGMQAEPGRPLSFTFADTADAKQLEGGYLHVRELYAREAYEPGAMAAGFVRGNVCLHAGGACVLAEMPYFDWPPPQHAGKISREDDGLTATLTMAGNPEEPKRSFENQTLVFRRTARYMKLTRQTALTTRWWFYGGVKFDADARLLTWNSGVTLRVTRGKVVAFKIDGMNEEMVVGMGKLKLDDPMPCVYPTIEVEPEGGVIEIEVRGVTA